MDDSLQEKSIGEMVVNAPFHQVCRHVRVILLDFDKKSSLFTIVTYIYVINIVLMNKLMFLFSI